MKLLSGYDCFMKPIVIAHKGASGLRPEHTRAAYELAIAEGADAVEPDLVVTKDGVLVIRHENEISTTTNVADIADFAALKTTKIVDGIELTGWFTEDFTWEQLQRLRTTENLKELRPKNRRFDGQQPILSLRELFEIVHESNSETRLVLEIKHAHYFSSLGFNLHELVLAEMSAWQHLFNPDEIVIESFELGILKQLRRAGTKAKLIFLLESDGVPADEVGKDESRSYDWYRSDTGLAFLAGQATGISVAKADLFIYDSSGAVVATNDLVERAHDFGLQVFTWTLRPENYFLNKAFQVGDEPAVRGLWRRELELIFETGIDGVFADFPGEVRAALSDLSDREHKITDE